MPPRPIMRCDPLPHRANPGKVAALRAVLGAYRAGAVLVAKEQWRLLFDTGRVNKMHRSPNETGLATVVGAANRLQMVRYQVVGMLDGWLESRADEVSVLVQASSLTPEMKHQVHVLNRRRLWFSREPGLAMPNGTAISPEARRLARQCMRRAMARCRRPNVSRINAVLDVRAVTLADADTASAFPLWATVSTMVPRQRVAIPLEPHAYFLARAGARKATVQLNEGRDGVLTFGVVTDVTEAFTATRATYQPRCEELALDWGLRTLFGTDQGDLLGRQCLERLQTYDRRITALATYRQRHGLKVRSKRYDREVRRLRGFLTETINRVLNRVVATQAPRVLIVERLDFRNGTLSRRMNRLVTNAGRRIVQDKLKALTEQYGIEVVEVAAAYSSQECSHCHYVDPKNRKGTTFSCRFCGYTRHADVNAPRTLRARRSRAGVSPGPRTKAATLRAVVAEHLRHRPERKTVGRWGTSRDPRRTNPYFTGALGAVISSGLASQSRQRLGASTP
jgi:putative transposase